MSKNLDIDALRAFRAELAEPDDLAVARTRYRVLRSVTPPERRRHRWYGGWLPAAASTAAVLALVVGLTVALHGTGRNTNGSSQSATGSGSATSPSSLDATSSGAPPGPAVDMSVTPVHLAPGQVLYVHDTTGTATNGYSHEMWLDVNGAIVLAIRRTDDGRVSIDVTEAQSAADIANARAELANNGPSLHRPTPAYLAGLPTDPHALVGLLKTQLGVDGQGNRREDLTTKNAAELLLVVEPLLSPALRAAFVNALALLPGTRLDQSPRTFAGHQVYLVIHSTSQGVDGFMVDRSTGRLVGDFAADTLARALSTGNSQWGYGVVNQSGVTP